MRQRIEAVINHLQSVAQILLAAIASRQIRKVGGGARVVGGTIIFVEPNTLNRKGEIVVHGDLATWFLK